MAIVWKSNEGKWTTGEIAVLGKIAFANVFYDACRSRDDPNTYKVTFLMHQPPKGKSFPGIAEAKRYAESEIKTWLKWSNLTHVEV